MTLENPYLSVFRRLSRPSDFPQAYGPSPSWENRSKLRRRYSYAVPTTGALVAIAKLTPIVEVGAGTGYWAWMLSRFGAKVAAYDQHPTRTGKNFYFQPDKLRQQGDWFQVHRGYSTAPRKHPGWTLLLVWPEWCSTMAYKALLCSTGEWVVYVGESAGGCTGDTKFHQELDKNFSLESTMDIPQYEGIHDQVWIWRRRNHVGTM